MAKKVLRAIGEMIILRFDEIEKKKRVTSGGIELIDGETDKQPVHEAIVETIGNNVDLETCGFEVGDSIVFNEHDIQQFKVENVADPLNPTMKGIIPAKSVWAVYS